MASRHRPRIGDDDAGTAGHSMRQALTSFPTALRAVFPTALRAVAAAAAALVWLLPAAPAEAADPLELNFYLSGPRYDGVVPPCEAALGTISAQFAEKEATFWNSALQISGYSDVHEVAFQPWRAAYLAIPRRFCAARATLNDGRRHTLRYSLIEDGGSAGTGPGVEWCLVGLDRNWAYNPACRAAGP
jgi:hypothetical protein